MDATSVEHAGDLQAKVPTVLHRRRAEFVDELLRHPFLARCGDGTVTMEELHRFLVQQGKYSGYFTRYLCALISHLDDGEDVLRLAGNLAEELGYGDGRGAPHSQIYAEMLKTFGISLAKHATYPETQNLIDTMLMLCRQPGGLAGLGALCLGGEAVVPALYTRIIDGFRSCGVGVERLRFFAIHVECDDGHADTMYEIIARKIGNSESSGISTLNAGEIVVNARLRFFDALLKELH